MKCKLGRRKGMKTYRVGVVGCGGIAQVHGAVLRDLEGVELIACADIRRERAEDFAQKYGGKAYDSMEAMLEAEDLDAVHLCTPHYLHTPMAKLAAGRGIHVFTEKPPVISWDQWREFQELEKAPGRVGVCFQNRYNKSVLMVETLLATGQAGPLLHGKRLAGQSGNRGRRGADQPVHPHPGPAGTVFGQAHPGGGHHDQPPPAGRD